MPSKRLAAYLNPWRARRERMQQRIDELRTRDGDDCRRCRRPMRFDLPRGHDRAPKIEQIVAAAGGGAAPLSDQLLCHVRCNQGMVDHTAEVQQRLSKRGSGFGIAAE